MGNEYTKQLDEIKQILSGFTTGASAKDIQSAGANIPIRTLQRRLEDLIALGLVSATGSARNRLYHMAATDTPALLTPSIPLSDAGLSVLSIVSQPIHLRIPVGYNRGFLQQYRPDIDSYLTEDEKSKLAELGRTSYKVRPAGTYAKEVLNRLLIDLSWNSSRLEGNTYSLLDTERLISAGETVNEKSAAEAQMILNHKDAIEFLVRDPNEVGFDRYTILNLHALLSNNLLSNPAAMGRLRTIEVGIGQSVYTPPGIPQQIEEMFELILRKTREISNPFEQAFFFMVHLPYLQPFDDVNKRVSRLAANIPLNRHNLAPLSFVDVPNDLYVQGIKGVYELNRIELLKDVFLWAYQRSAARYAAVRQQLGEPDPVRLQYREEIRAAMTEIVARPLSRPEAAIKIQEIALQIPEPDRAKYIETVETELLNLHEGNFARYWISPTQFQQWEKLWKR